MEKKGLNSASKAYYEKQEMYEKFSVVEDTPHKIDDFLKDKVRGKRILDAGCGSGKFLPLLESLSEEYVGIDLSEIQVREALKKKQKITSVLQVGDLEHLFFETNSFDVVVSAWVLGTIIDLEKRKKAVEELKRVLKTNGVIYLIENASDGEFEKIRNHKQKTDDYNAWLEQQGFHMIKKINTYFDFSDVEEAKNVFKEIYGEEVSKNLKNKNIKHEVFIFQYQLK